MSDMRLIVAGAGGRMGRALTRVISETKARFLPARWRRPVPNSWARMPACSRAARQRRQAVGRSVVAVGRCRRHPRFHRAGRDRRNVAIAAQRASCTSSAPPAVRLGRRRDQERHPRAIVVKSGNMSLGVNLLAALVKRVARDARRRISTSRSSKCITASKVDAPSGTALLLGEAAAAGRGIALAAHSGAAATA